MIAPRDVSAIVVTRGDVDLAAVVESLATVGELVIWDNAREPVDVAVYGRYAAISRCSGDVVLVQDDDVLLPPESIAQLCEAYEPGWVVCNQPQPFRDTGFYDDHALVGFGAVFDHHLPAQAFDRIHQDIAWDDPEEAARFYRTCDIAFTALTPRVLIDVAYADREFASGANRMWKQPGHVAERTRMLALVRKVTC